MDNLAHSLVGLAASKAGLERLSPGATTVCILAANAPDIDFIAAISGDRWTVLHYHRGVTHSIVGTLILGLIIPALFCVIGRAISRSRDRPSRLRFRGLAIASLIAAATHPLLDWTNNYGVRPLLPWSGKWFYGDLVFVVDPVLWVVFGAAAFLLTSNSRRQVRLWTLLGGMLTLLVFYATLAGRATEHPFLTLLLWLTAIVGIIACYKINIVRRLGHRIALIAFVILLAYWGSLTFLHGRALARTRGIAAEITADASERVIKVAAMPTLAHPGHWRCLVETDRATYRFDVYLNHVDHDPMNLVRYEKPGQAEAEIVDQAKRDRRAQSFFEFARFPVERIVGMDCTTQTLVQFADLRYTEPGKARGSFALDVPLECPTGRAPSNGR